MDKKEIIKWMTQHLPNVRRGHQELAADAASHFDLYVLSEDKIRIDPKLFKLAYKVMENTK